MSERIRILAFESSCDDTSAAVIENSKVLANIVANQKVHKEFGGVVPELASRSHQKNIIPVTHQALTKAGVSISDIDAIAYTSGPGLLGSLLVGSSFAKSLALALNLPIIAVNHMQAHILAHFIVDSESQSVPSFPFLNLTVSGGHTQLVLVKNYLEMEIVGETIDDAAGEAFDKIAKMIGLDYPGGPMIDKLSKNGNPNRFSFPHPRVGGLNFSFSGLKTSVLYFLKKEIAINSDFIELNKADICASVQKTIVDILLSRMIKAADQLEVNELAISGGVSANSELRRRFMEVGERSGRKAFIPKFEYCTDNAAMVAMAGYYKFINNEKAPLSELPKANLKF